MAENSLTPPVPTTPVDLASGLANAVSSVSFSPSVEDQAKNVRRTHVETLIDEANAKIEVKAPGYEQMLSTSRWEDLPM
jgi:hypothetical protein